MKTPMQELIEWMKQERDLANEMLCIDIRNQMEYCLYVAMKKLPAEKQMVIDAYDEGVERNLPLDGEKYFSEKYGE